MPTAHTHAVSEGLEEGGEGCRTSEEVFTMYRVLVPAIDVWHQARHIEPLILRRANGGRQSHGQGAMIEAR